MEIVSVLYICMTLPLLIGTTKKFKMYAGGLVIGSALIFLVGEIIIKVQTDFYTLGKMEWINQGHAETMGKWVVPFFLIGVAIILILVNIRLIREFLKRTGRIRWAFAAAVVAVDAISLFLVPFMLFVVALMFFPFAP
ncbi:hypothetical protein [Bacillus sp. KH172YL63]|uniref:hypothetical protein n=1 Tax=Bacillus sp. KH172YL63 TaxID=2709784 RepID=UPI0013E4BBA4|nr:hypothetical protein [Bacillus sp. KH172YL63]BCB02759.1 hypothetical protein KH172YL63_08920 [Bacillus sp. KH172YL63]